MEFCLQYRIMFDYVTLLLKQVYYTSIFLHMMHAV